MASIPPTLPNLNIDYVTPQSGRARRPAILWVVAICGLIAGAVLMFVAPADLIALGPSPNEYWRRDGAIPALSTQVVVLAILGVSRGVAAALLLIGSTGLLMWRPVAATLVRAASIALIVIWAVKTFMALHTLGTMGFGGLPAAVKAGIGLSFVAGALLGLAFPLLAIIGLNRPAVAAAIAAQRHPLPAFQPNLMEGTDDPTGRWTLRLVALALLILASVGLMESLLALISEMGNGGRHGRFRWSGGGLPPFRGHPLVNAVLMFLLDAFAVAAAIVAMLNARTGRTMLIVVCITLVLQAQWGFTYTVDNLIRRPATGNVSFAHPSDDGTLALLSYVLGSTGYYLSRLAFPAVLIALLTQNPTRAAAH